MLIPNDCDYIALAKYGGFKKYVAYIAFSLSQGYFDTKEYE